MDLLKMVLFGFMGVAAVVAFMALMTKALGLGVLAVG
jgi:hypothetical protein